MKRFHIILPVIMLLVLISQPVMSGEQLAQEFIEVRIEIPSLLRICIDREDIQFTAADILEGEERKGRIIREKPAAVKISAAGNTPYALWISSPEENLTSRESEIPISRLEWRLYENEWKPLTSEQGQIIEEIAPGSKEISLDLRLNVHFVDPIGDYEGGIFLTISTI